MGYYFFLYNKVTNANALLIIKDYTWNKEAKLLKSFAFIQAEEKTRGKGKRKLYKRKRERRAKKKTHNINGVFES